MKVDIQENSHANVTFNNLIKVAIRGEHSYTVKYYCNDEFAGEMNLGGGNWGGYEMVVGDWRIEFWQDHEKVSEFNNDLKDNPILIIADLPKPQPGKNLSTGKLINRAHEIQSQYECDVIFYFKGSEQYDLSPFKTLKMNDEYDFSLILEENYG